jgi:hypothetical protein
VAKRKTIQEKEIEKITKDSLNELGRLVSVVTARNSKVSKLQKNHLRDSLNYRVRPFDTLTISQFGYGKWNTPKGKATPKDRSNIKDTPILNAIDQHVPNAKKVYIKSIADLLKSPIKKK